MNWKHNASKINFYGKGLLEKEYFKNLSVKPGIKFFNSL